MNKRNTKPISGFFIFCSTNKNIYPGNRIHKEELGFIISRLKDIFVLGRAQEIVRPNFTWLEPLHKHWSRRMSEKSVSCAVLENVSKSFQAKNKGFCCH